MASLTFHYCKQLCTKALASTSVARVSATKLAHPRSRPLQLSATHRITGSDDKKNLGLTESLETVEDKDFDADRDSVLGDFSKYNISKDTVNRLKRQGVNHLFEVQYKTYNEVREGIDCFVQARTGTGKTLGFALPIIEAIQSVVPEKTSIFPRPPQVLTVAPTRELAIQIAKEFEKFASPRTKVACFYGGVSLQGQDRALYQGVDILVGTPGRLLDHLMNGKLNLSTVKHVILDEADRMLDMGFQKDIENIFYYAYTKTNKPQTLLFSATLPAWVRDITRKYTSDNMQRFDLITTAVKSAILVDHKSVLCSQHQHADVVNHLVKKHCGPGGKVLVFTATKRAAENLSWKLGRNADYITGDKSQQQREHTLSAFKGGRVNVLVATDVAARGLDIPKIDLVIQTEPPNDVDSYIHRAGRTGRAGTNGLSIILYDGGQLGAMSAVQKHAGIRFTAVEEDKVLDELVPQHNKVDFENYRGPSTSNNRGRSGSGRSGSFGGFDRRPSRDFGNRDRRPSREFGGFDRRPSRESGRQSSENFGGFDRRPSRESGRQSSENFGGSFGGLSSRGGSSSRGGFGQRSSSDFDRKPFSGGFDRKPQSDFGGFERKPQSDFGGFDRKSSRDFGGFDRKPQRDFGGFDRKSSRDDSGFDRKPRKPRDFSKFDENDFDDF